MALTTCWRGTVGLIKPNFRPGSTEDLIRMLPEGIGVIPVHIELDKGTRGQFESSLPAYEKMVAKLAELEADIIHPAGSPPFQMLGYRGERELIRKWEKKYKRPVVHHLPAQAWEIQKRLHVRHPFPHLGRLLAEMP